MHSRPGTGDFPSPASIDSAGGSLGAFFWEKSAESTHRHLGSNGGEGGILLTAFPLSCCDAYTSVIISVV